MKLKDRLTKWWYFRFRNPVVREGEAGGFRWRFRRFWLDIETISGNFKAKFMADEHPYGYLLSGKGDDNIHGFAVALYIVSQHLTQDQGFVDDIRKAMQKYDKRLEKKAASAVKEDETEEKIALEEVKAVQEFVEMPKKERRKVERDANGRFKKAEKEAEKHEN